MNGGARPRRGAPPKGEVSARERILATASELFYREGIRAIGVDTVVEQSGVSKTSLYRLYDSKDALIAAFAAEKDRLFWMWWDRVEAQRKRMRGEGNRSCKIGWFSNSTNNGLADAPQVENLRYGRL